jgi:hypothetical protein
MSYTLNRSGQSGSGRARRRTPAGRSILPSRGFAILDDSAGGVQRQLDLRMRRTNDDRRRSTPHQAERILVQKLFAIGIAIIGRIMVSLGVTMTATDTAAIASGGEFN